MSLKKLATLVPPPAKPLDCGSAKAWAAIQTKLGRTLPQDLFDFAMLYGTGEFYGDLRVLNPFAKSYQLCIDAEKPRIEFAWKHGLNYFLDQQGYDLGEKQPDLYPWGSDSNGNCYFWLMAGKPNRWPTLTETEECEFAFWDMSMTAFLVKIFSNQIVGMIDPDPLTPERRVFMPRRY